jgi:hypothetical protein
MSFIGITQVLINDDSDRTVTGVIVYDRDNGGTLVIPAGSAFPVVDLIPGELFFRSDLMILYRRNDANDAWESSSAAPTAHAPTHIEGGTDVIDGDRLEIDFTPVNYAQDTSPVEVDAVTQLTAHLKGIDDALATSIFEDLATISNLDVDTVTNEYDEGVGANDDLFVRDTLSAVVAEAGTYRLDYSYQWNHDATNNDFVAQIKRDGVREYFHRQEPKDSVGSGPGSTDQVYPASGFILLALTPATYSFVFSFGTSNDNDESTVLRSTLMFYRVS